MLHILYISQKSIEYFSYLKIYFKISLITNKIEINKIINKNNVIT